jgi:hypothetical protein
MLCPACPTVGFIGGILGGYLEINPPQTFKGKALSVFITSTLVSLTVIALKVFANISVCSGAGLSLLGISLIMVKTIPLAIIYSIGVNYILGRLFPELFNPLVIPKKSCCCDK